MRPSGVVDSIAFACRPVEPRRLDALGLDHAGIQGVDADLARRQLLRQHAGDGIDRALGGGVDRGVRRREVETPEPMLMMLPPPSAKCGTAAASPATAPAH